MKTQLYPFLFNPVYKDHVWGGRKIPEIFDREAQPGICAESWEIADRPEGMSIVRNGPQAGRSLRDLVRSLGERLVGADNPAPQFPLLIKIIDARERLSLQVHPDDRTAALYGGEAKTEMWYVLDAPPGARVFAGLVPGTDEAALVAALQQESVERLLQPVPVRPGDAIYVPGGRAHAIDQGCLLLEVQQSSNTTYRVHDWGRKDAHGGHRPLHLQQALQVINWQDASPSKVEPEELRSEDGNRRRKILGSPCFHVQRVDLATADRVTNDGASFHALFVLEGSVRVVGNDMAESITRGTSCLLPAALATYAVEPRGGPASVLRISIA